MTRQLDPAFSEIWLNLTATANLTGGLDFPPLAADNHQLRGSVSWFGHSGHVFLEVAGERVEVAQRVPEYPTADDYAPEFSTAKGWLAGSTVVGVWVDLEGNEYRTDRPPQGVQCLIPQYFGGGSAYFWGEQGLVNGATLVAYRLISLNLFETPYYYQQQPEEPELEDLIDPPPLVTGASTETLYFS